MLEDMIKYNNGFVEKKEYLKYGTDKYPSKKCAVLSCMDTRLTHLLPAALGLKNGDVKIIKNAGAQVTHPYGSVMKSLIIAVYDLGVEEILVIGHDDCGVQMLEGQKLINEMIERGIPKEKIEEINKTECNVENWLSGFHDVSKSVLATVKAIKEHPFIPKDMKVYGLIIDPLTGELRNAE